MVLELGSKCMAAELKAGLAPDITRSFASAVKAPGSPQAYPISRSADAFPMARNITAISLIGILESGEARDFLNARP